MTTARAVAQLLRDYPEIFFACHVRHVPDPGIRRQLTARQREVLDHLSDEHGMTVRQLAGHAGVSPSTMSIMVDRLVARGLVARREDPADRRRVELRLTPKGLRLRGKQEVLDRTRVRRLLAELTASERKHALDGLGLLARAARRVMTPAEHADGRSLTTED
ncbi:MAG: MarR family winged helix-turn-helix transcriptional regulator [Gemmatimonadales bacterium]